VELIPEIFADDFHALPSIFLNVSANLSKGFRGSSLRVEYVLSESEEYRGLDALLDASNNLYGPDPCVSLLCVNFI
jgi:hypothetical protein